MTDYLVPSPPPDICITILLFNDYLKREGINVQTMFYKDCTIILVLNSMIIFIGIFCLYRGISIGKP